MNKLPGQQQQGPVAFLTFATRKDAEGAKEQFQGFHMDPNIDNLTMKIEFAKVPFLAIFLWVNFTIFVEISIFWRILKF